MGSPPPKQFCVLKFSLLQFVLHKIGLTKVQSSLMGPRYEMNFRT